MWSSEVTVRPALVFVLVAAACSGPVAAQPSDGLTPVSVNEERVFLAHPDTVVFTEDDLAIEERQSYLIVGTRKSGACQFSFNSTRSLDDIREGYEEITAERAHNETLCMSLVDYGWVRQRR